MQQELRKQGFKKLNEQNMRMKSNKGDDEATVSFIYHLT